LSAVRIAIALLVIILFAAVGIVVFESIKAGRPEPPVVTLTPKATPTPRPTATPTPTPTPKTTYSADQGMEVVRTVYTNTNGFGNKQYFSSDFYNTTKAKELNYDPIYCSATWPPVGGVSYELSGISSGGIAAYVATEHWGDGGGDHRIAVYVDLNTLKFTDVVCPAFHSGSY
jgi:hypothetical protein